MPVKTRIISFRENAYYHVFNRGNNKQRIFLDEKDYSVLRKITRQTLEKYPEITIKQFALLPNHYHFLIHQTDERTLSKFMRCLNIRYTQYFQKKYRVVGRIFGSSYHARVLLDNRAIEAVRVYIKNNPLEAGYTTWRHFGMNVWIARLRMPIANYLFCGP